MRKCDGPQGSVDVASIAQLRASGVGGRGGMAWDDCWAWMISPERNCKREEEEEQYATLLACGITTKLIF